MPRKKPGDGPRRDYFRVPKKEKPLPKTGLTDKPDRQRTEDFSGLKPPGFWK